MAETIKVEGLDNFAQALNLLSQNIARSVLRGGVSAAGKVIRDETKLRAPVYTGPAIEGHPPPGTLKRAVSYGRARWESGEGKEVYHVFVRQAKNGAVGQKGVKAYGKFDAFYARWVEYGTSKMAAHPFMRPAYESTKMTSYEAMIGYYANRLPEEVKKLGFGWVN